MQYAEGASASLTCAATGGKLFVSFYVNFIPRRKVIYTTYIMYIYSWVVCKVLNLKWKQVFFFMKSSFDFQYSHYIPPHFFLQGFNLLNFFEKLALCIGK